MRKLLAAVLCGALIAGCLCACSGSDVTVSVQSVAEITGYGAVGLYDSYAGIVEAGETVDIEKDEKMEVSEILVKAGEDVTQGQTLFTYDTDEVSLERDKAALELEQFKSAIETKQEQITALEKEKQYASASAQLDYTLQIQELQIDIQQTQLNSDAKEKEIARYDELLLNTEVTAPVSGTVKSINLNGETDEFGNPKPFLSLIQSGSFRVKGTINEQQLNALSAGMEVTIRSRVDQSEWHGSVLQIDYEHPVNDDSGYYYYGVDEMTQSSKYPFYITLDDDTGLLIGQHVYIAPSQPDAQGEGIPLPACYLVDETYVWAEKKGELEKRKVTVGEYDEATDTYPVLGGLKPDDYIAFPSEDCTEGAKVSIYSASAQETEADFDPVMPGFDGDFAGEEIWEDAG